MTNDYSIKMGNYSVGSLYSPAMDNLDYRGKMPKISYETDSSGGEGSGILSAPLVRGIQ